MPYGSIVGAVVDQSEVVVPNATVTITNRDTGQTCENTTDLARSYDLKVSASGFQTETREGIVVTISTVTRVNLRLEVGAITEQATVSASVATLRTDKSDVRHEITAETLTSLPFPNNQIPRNWISPIFDSIQKLISLPNQISPTDPNNLQGTYEAAATLKFNRNDHDIKSSWRASPNLVIWGKFSRLDALVTGKHIFGEMIGPNIGTAREGDVNVNMPTFGFTRTFLPTFIMDAVFGYQRHDQDIVGTGQCKNWGLGVFGNPGTNEERQYAHDMRYSGVPYFSGFCFSTWGLSEGW